MIRPEKEAEAKKLADDTTAEMKLIDELMDRGDRVSVITGMQKISAFVQRLASFLGTISDEEYKELDETLNVLLP